MIELVSADFQFSAVHLVREEVLEEVQLEGKEL